MAFPSSFSKITMVPHGQHITRQSVYTELQALSRFCCVERSKRPYNIGVQIFCLGCVVHKAMDIRPGHWHEFVSEFLAFVLRLRLLRSCSRSPLSVNTFGHSSQRWMIVRDWFLQPGFWDAAISRTSCVGVKEQYLMVNFRFVLSEERQLQKGTLTTWILAYGLMATSLQKISSQACKTAILSWKQYVIVHSLRFRTGLARNMNAQLSNSNFWTLQDPTHSRTSTPRRFKINKFNPNPVRTFESNFDGCEG